MIFSATESEQIFTLCTRGSATEIKTLAIHDSGQNITFSGNYYHFEIAKALVGSTKFLYKTFTTGMNDGNGLATVIAASVVSSIIVGACVYANDPLRIGHAWAMGAATVPAPWILAAVPTAANVVTIIPDAIITEFTSLTNKDAIAARKLKRLMTEKSVRMSSRVFNSFVEHLKAI